MNLSAKFPGQDISVREKLILTGLYLSKFDTLGLRRLGFDSFTEAFNVIGFALRSKPASIKNYRDEFDPLFPNGRKGWHKREIRDHCLAVFERYNGLGSQPFTQLVKSFFTFEENIVTDNSQIGTLSDSDTFAQRLITGLAAEHYFESVHKRLHEFDGYSLQNTSRLGCGYDFRMQSEH